MIRTALRFSFLLLTGGFSAAQTLPILPQNPASLHWYRLKTPHFRVIYPAGLDSSAERTANRLESLYVPASASLGRPPRPVSVLLQNQTTVSNGFVTLFPRHSEFNAVAPQDPSLLGTYNWLDLLAVHEYRHVVQYDKALTGYGRVLYTLLGNTGLFLPNLTVPDWFAEGDAVSNETLLSTSGRGRIPNFDLGMRANLLTGYAYSYPEAVCGSYHDNVPDHYVLGYFLTTYLKRTYGPDVWDKVLNRNYRRFPWPFAFSASIKDVTGLRVEDAYRNTINDLTETWQQQLAQQPVSSAAYFPVRVEQQPKDQNGQALLPPLPSNANAISPAVHSDRGASSRQTSPPPRRAVYTNYQHPQFVSDSAVVCVKSGYGDIPRLVLLRKNAREQTMYVQGPTNDPDMLSATARKVCWIEYGFSPRWGARVYSNIRLLDLTTRKLTRLTHRGRFLAAALSPDDSRLVVVQSTAAYKAQLVVLDAVSGKILRTLPNPQGAYYLHPRWTADGRDIIAVSLRDGKKTIQRIDPQTGTAVDLLPPVNENISHPQPWGKYVLYNSPRTGIDNVFALDTATRQVFQVSARPLGAYHASVSPSGTELSFDDFTASGSRIATMPLVPADWKPVSEPASANPVQFFGKLPQLEPGAAQGRQLLRDSANVLTDYRPSRFRRLAHALNVYNYGPTVTSTGQTLTAGLTSQDLLNTTQVSAGYTYNQAERVGNFYALLSYQGLFPVFDVSFLHGNRRTSFVLDHTYPIDSLRTDTWTFNQVTAGIRLPLTLTNSRYRQAISASAYYNFLQVTGYDLPVRNATEVGGEGYLNALTYSFGYSRLLLQSKRDVAPRWGQTLQINYRNTPLGGKLQGEQFGAQVNLYFPGLAKHHSLRLRAGYQQQTFNNYIFSPVIFYPRGQPYVIDEQIRAGSVEYRLPLADTHWSLGRLLYIQRIKANLFYDRAEGQSVVEVRDIYNRLRGYETVMHSYQTMGLDVSFVFNALRLRTPLEAGIRTIYNRTSGQLLIQPLVIDIGF